MEDPMSHHECGDAEEHSYQECLLSDQEFIDMVGEDAAKRITWLLDHPEEIMSRVRRRNP